MASILEDIIEELNEYVLSGKFGVDEIYGDIIRRLFHLSDDVRDYLFYELESKAQTKYNLHKDTPTETYLWNITDSIWSMYDAWYKAGEVEIGDNFDIDTDGTITFSVTTLTSCSEPDVNYYDDGLDSVKDFVKELKDKIQAKSIKIEEDWDFDEHTGNPTSSHMIIVKMWGE